MGDTIHLYNLIKELFLLLDDGDQRLLGRFDLTVSRFYILIHLGEDPGISSRCLADRLICDKSNVSRLVRGMVLDGLVEKKAHETDGRKQRLFLTESGMALRTAVLTEHTVYTHSRLDCCTRQERTSLEATLDKIKRNLNTEVELMPD